MRAHKVHHKQIGTRFVGSAEEARKVRQDMFEVAEPKVLRKEIIVEMVEIPTTKAELLDWLNKNFGA